MLRTSSPRCSLASEVGSCVSFFKCRAYKHRQASAFYLETSNVSTAQANITVSENLTSIEVNFNSSIGTLAVVNLVETEVTLVTLTFLPDQFPSRLDIQSLIITVDDGACVYYLFISRALLTFDSLTQTIVFYSSDHDVTSINDSPHDHYTNSK